MTVSVHLTRIQNINFTLKSNLHSLQSVSAPQNCTRIHLITSLQTPVTVSALEQENYITPTVSEKMDQIHIYLDIRLKIQKKLSDAVMHLFHLHSAPGLHPKALFHLSNQLDCRSRRQVHPVKADVKYYGSVASQQFCCKMALLSKFHISLATRTDFVKIVKFMWILVFFINADVNRALFFPFMVQKNWDQLQVKFEHKL